MTSLRLSLGWLNGLLLGGLLLLSLASLCIGYVPLGLDSIVRGLVAAGSDSETIIVREIRLPRLLLAWCVGASLGLAGAALQGLLRNPLAEPGLLGISSSASLGAVIALYFGLTTFTGWLLPLSAMLGAALATAALYGVARYSPSNLTLILAGIAISSLAAALTSLALNLSPNPYDVNDIVLWLLGSLSDRSFNDLQLALPFIVLGIVLLLTSAQPLATLNLGEETAQSLGVDLARLRRLIIVGTALCVGASVAIAGTIGFVGLVVPHLLRPLVDYRPDRLLVPSAIGGALLLLLADTALRLINTEQELMLGVMTALIGAPFFLWLVVRSRRYWA